MATKKTAPEAARPMEDVLTSIANLGGFDNTESMLAKIAREQALGTKGSMFNDILYGFNRTTQGYSIPRNTDMQGLTFFTRPNLNLSYDNIAQVRSLTPLLSRDAMTYQRVIQALLDPRGTRRQRDTPLINSNLPFIALLSNSVVSCSGWPDLRANAYSTNEGMAQETWMMNDKLIEHYGRFDLTVNFQNMLGDPITLLFFTWLTYMGAVYTGRMVPYPETLIENEIDYMTRIYRLVLDYSGTYVQKWAATGAAMPVSIDIGNSFNFSRDSPFTDSADQVQVPFACIGAMYNDPIILHEFNRVVTDFQPKMVSPQDWYVQIKGEERKLFNFNGYPRINLITNELEWWVEKDLYVAYRKGTIDTSTLSGVQVSSL
jgi:hypothetical protein